MHVAVTGATGLVGANLVTALNQAGHTVRATRRAGSNLSTLDGMQVDWAEAELRNASALAAAFEGAELVFHCAAAVTVKRKVEPWIFDANVTGTRNVIEACRAAGVRRLLHCSSTVTMGLGQNGQPANEKSPWNIDTAGLDDAYATTKRQAEEVVMAEAANGLDAVVVNPGYMFGPYDSRPSSGKLLVDVVRRAVPGCSAGWNSFVDVRDVVSGMIAAAERGRSGERYILGGHNLSYRELFGRIASVAGTRPITRVIPRWLASIPALFGDLQEALAGKEPLLNSSTIAWAYEPNFIVSSEKANRELDYAPRPIEEGISAALAWFRQADMVGPLPNFP
jgi:dihydroflavonol-4-reductase